MGCTQEQSRKPSLLQKHPEIARQFVRSAPGYEHKNPSNITPGSRVKFIWRCPACQHEWKARVDSRTGGTGCPACARAYFASEADSLQALYPDLANEFLCSTSGYEHKNPSNVLPGSDAKFIWRCSDCEHEWKATVNDRARGGTNCPVCANRLVTINNCLQTLCPDLANEFVRPASGYEHRNPSNVTPGSGAKFIWRCSTCQHEWEADVSARKQGSGCPNCANFRTRDTRYLRCAKYYSLQALYPNLASEFVCPASGYEHRNPSNVTPGSGAKFIWRCSTCQHEWEAHVYHRNRGDGCPLCDEHRGWTLIRSKNLLLKHWDALSKLDNTQRREKLAEFGIFHSSGQGRTLIENWLDNKQPALSDQILLSFLQTGVSPIIEEILSKHNPLDYGGPRPRIPAKVRNTVLARDKNRCLCCSSKEDLTLDHIVPRSKGGEDTVDNLRVLCRSCNSICGTKGLDIARLRLLVQAPNSGRSKVLAAVET